MQSVDLRSLPVVMSEIDQYPADVCCDVCAKKCKCGRAMCSEPEYGHFVIMDHEAREDDKERCRVLADAETATFCSERGNFKDANFCSVLMT